MTSPRRLLCCLLLLLSIGFQGCNGAKAPASLSPSAANATEQVPRSDGPLAYGDVISINVYRHEDLSTDTKINELGRISLPLIGDVQAAGKTMDQLRADLADKWAKYVVQPQVMITLTQSSYRTAMIFGEVQAEGMVVLDHDVTLWEAVAKAGGFSRDASEGNVVVIRGAMDDAAGQGKVQVFAADMRLSASEKNPSFNFKGHLAPGDIIFVPSSTLADVERFMMRLRNILEPLISAQRLIIFMPQVRDAVIDILQGYPPDYNDSGVVQQNSGGSGVVGGENLTNQGGFIPSGQ